MKCSLGSCSEKGSSSAQCLAPHDTPGMRIRRLFIADTAIRQPALANDNPAPRRPLAARPAFWLAPLVGIALLAAIVA